MQEDIASLLALGQQLQQDWPHAPTGQRGHAIQLASRLLRVRDRTGHTHALRANPAQRLFEQHRGPANIILKARQMGMTTWIAGRFFLKTITARGVLSLQVAHTQAAAETLFTVVQRMWDNLPAALREGPLRRKRANVGQMVFAELDSELRIVSAADPNAGRGSTVQNLHCSEVGRWPGDAAATLAGLRAALVPGGELCLESTPQGAYGCFYNEWESAPETGLVRHFLPWWLEPAYVGPAIPRAQWTAAECDLATHHSLSARQIGFRRSLERSFHALRSQEFAEDAVTCFRATGECCFSIEAVEQRLQELAQPLAQPLHTRRGGALHLWLPPVPDRQYCVAVDSAGGGPAGDFAAIQVIELRTGLQCAELRQHLAPMELAHAAAALAAEYNHAEIAVERNNHGAAVLAYLHTRERYPRLYAQNGLPGWLTSASSKPAMISRLGTLLAEQPTLFASQRLLRECRSFIAQPNGATGAAPGAHDDCVMSMAIAHAVRAEHLQHSTLN